MSNKVYFPEYWAKKKDKLGNQFLNKLQETADSEPICKDEYGKYKIGTFLHRNAIVTVNKEDYGWNVHIYSEQPIGMPLIKEVRYKFIPDNVVMAQLYGPRMDGNGMKGVLLYEIPGGAKEVVE